MCLLVSWLLPGLTYANVVSYVALGTVPVSPLLVSVKGSFKHRPSALCIYCPGKCTVLQTAIVVHTCHLDIYSHPLRRVCAMPLLEVNTAGLSRRPSLGQKLKEKLLTRIASITSTMRVQTLPQPEALDENNVPRLEEDDSVAIRQLRSASSHPLECVTLSAGGSNDHAHSQASCQDNALHSEGSMSLRRTVTLDDEHFAPPMSPSGPSGNQKVCCACASALMHRHGALLQWSKLLRTRSAPDDMAHELGALAKVCIQYFVFMCHTCFG